MNCFDFAEREQLSEEEKELFIADLRAVCSEYFEGDDRYSIDVTKTEKGFSVCMIFDAVRIKKFKRPR